MTGPDGLDPAVAVGVVNVREAIDSLGVWIWLCVLGVDAKVEKNVGVVRTDDAAEV